MKPLKLWHKAFLITVETVMVLVVLALVGGGVLLWQLNQGPIEVGFARKYIASELSDPAHNLSMTVGRVFLDWSRLDSRPQISLKDAALKNTRTGQTVISVELLGVTLSRRALLFAQIRPRTVVIQNPLLTVVRNEDGSMALALEQKAVPETEKTPLNVQSEFLFEFLDMLAKPGNDVPRDWPARSLRMIMIDGARIMVEDHILQRSWLIPRADLAFRREAGSLISSASLWLDDTALETEPAIKVEAAYMGASRNIVSNLTITKLSAPFLASRFPDLDWLQDQNVVLTGKAQATLGAGMQLTGFEATLESDNGNMLIPDVYDRPLTYQRLILNLGYDGPSGILTLQDSLLVFADDFSVTISGQVMPVKDTKGYAMPLKVFVHSLPQARIAEFWPSILKGDSAEDWALKRLSEGRIFDSVIDLHLDAARVGEEWSVNLTDLKTSFNIENMTVDYSAPLMPVRKASGKGQYDYKTDRMDIDVESGLLGDMTIKSGKIIIDVVVGETIGTASIETQLSGPVKTVFKYINSDPIGVARDVVSDVERIEGTADLNVNVSFPTLADLPAEKIKVAVEGTANKVLLPGLVNGLDVSGGPVKVSVKNERVDASGKGRIDGRDMNFTYAQYFEAKGHDFGMKVNADLMVDTGLRSKFGMDLSGWMEGSVPAKIIYTDFGGGRAEIDVTVDATPATLMVKPMGYSKAPGIQASASARAIMKNNILTGITNLNVQTPEGRLEKAEMSFTQSGKETLLTSGKMPQARLNETDVAIKFDISPQNIITMSIQGSFLDARPFLENDKKGQDYVGPGLVATVNVARMRTADARLIEKAKAFIDMDKQGDLNHLELDAVAGGGALVFRYKPDQARARMLLLIEAENAGAALQAFGVYENTRGGRLLVQGASAAGGDKRMISGKAELTDFRLINAPVLARLVNSLSLPGILSLLGSDGIDFTRLEADFTWEKKKGVDLIIAKDGKTSGASMGLTFEGTLDRMQDTINASGTIVPASMLNSILSNIPIVGDILTAGSGDAVFAATYTVRGPAKNPTIMVNPLAVLAPGFLRQIFFE